jgi:hypothetical protein
VSRRDWIVAAALTLLFAALLTYGLSQGDAGYVRQNASENFCFS